MKQNVVLSSKKKISWIVFVFVLLSGWAVMPLFLLRTSASPKTTPKTSEPHTPSVQMWLPARYATLVNPFSNTADTLEQGKNLYLKVCASCHGVNADGTGPAAQGLSPKPANFRDRERLSKYSDAYLFYRVTEGKPGTAMPAFSAALSAEQKWLLITYLRSLH